jgi:hypothetical protein
MRALFLGPSPNTAPFVANVAAADIIEASSSDFTIDVTYDDDYGLDTSTFDVADITLTGERDRAAFLTKSHTLEYVDTFFVSIQDRRQR